MYKNVFTQMITYRMTLQILKCPVFNIKLHPVVRLKFPNFGEGLVTFHCYYFQVHYDTEWS